MNLIPMTGGAEVEVDATPEQLFALAADVTRIGAWSSECVGARWRDGATEARAGVRFRGRNRLRWARWSRLCRFTVVEPPTRIAWRTIGLHGLIDSTEWTLEFTPVGPGRTVITQRYEVKRIFGVQRLLYAQVAREHRDRSDALRGDLLRLGAAAAAQSSRVVRPVA